MRARRFVLSSLFLAVCTMLAGTTAYAAEPGIPVLVHYCNWHGKEGNNSSWRTATTLPTYSDGYCVPDPEDPAGFDCFTGYRSLDTATIVHHNAQFAANGLVPLISWWDKVGENNQRSGDLFSDLYFSIPSSVQAGFLYEITGRLQKTTIGNLSDGRPHEVYDFGRDITSENAQRFISDIRYLDEKYIKRYPERFFRIDGKPVVFLWLSHAFHGRFDLAVAELRKTTSVYIIGSNFGVHGAPGVDSTPTALETIRGLDAVSAYSIYDGERTTRYGGHLSREWVQEYAMAALDWNAWLRTHAPQVKLILPTTFTYHDSRDNPVLDKTTPAEARYLADMARALIEQGRAGCTSVLPYALHVSWNEHFEGTSIEPSFRNRAGFQRNGLTMGEDYGDSFLKILQETFSPPLAPAPACPAP